MPTGPVLSCGYGSATAIAINLDLLYDVKPTRQQADKLGVWKGGAAATSAGNRSNCEADTRRTRYPHPGARRARREYCGRRRRRSGPTWRQTVVSPSSPPEVMVTVTGVVVVFAENRVDMV